MLELVALGSNPTVAAEAAEATGGALYVKHHGERDTIPYTTLVRAATDAIESVARAADVGLYVCFARAVKPERRPLPPERVIASFGLVRHPDRSHREADDHWRDLHGPLALASHSAMCDYTQLSVVVPVSGLPLDGIALCAFESRQDLREKFFDDDEARSAIQADVAAFADTSGSPRRVVLVQQR